MLAHAPYRVVCVARGRADGGRADGGPIHLIVYHTARPRRALQTWIARVQRQQATGVVLVGPDDGAERTAWWMRAGVVDYVVWPCRRSRLRAAVRHGLRTQQAFWRVQRMQTALATAYVDLERDRNALRQANARWQALAQISQAFAAHLAQDKIGAAFAAHLAPVVPIDWLTIHWDEPAWTWTYRTKPGDANEAEGDARLDLPLQVATHPVGSLSVGRHRARPFSPDEQEWLQTVTGPLAMALQNAAQHQHVRALAYTDPLTGLANRRAWRAAIARVMDRSRRTGSVFSLLVIDLDRFKDINDVHGHVTGDRILQMLAERITSLVRVGDVVARYGGEEFAVLMPRANRDAGWAVADRIGREIAASPCLVDGVPVSVTVSIGVATWSPATDEPADTVLARADAALYRAKLRGRNRVEVAEEPLQLEPGATPSAAPVQRDAREETARPASA